MWCSLPLPPPSAPRAVGSTLWEARCLPYSSTPLTWHWEAPTAPAGVVLGTCPPEISWPLISFIGQYTWPAWMWWSTNVYDFHHINFLFENLTVANVTNASISLRTRRKNDTSFLNQDPFKQDIFAEARANL